MRQTLRFLVMAVVTQVGLAVVAAEPVVTNVRAAQRVGTKLVDVYYDLSGADGSETVRVAVSSDGGSSYSVPATSFNGDVGSGVENGANKHVVWNAGEDWNGQLSQAVKFRITASGTPTIPNDFALIPAGTFTMGDAGYSAPTVSVHVSAFYMAKYEVTKAQWDDVRTWGLVNGYTDLAPAGGKAANHPAHSVSWYSVVKWCNARSEKEGLIPCYTASGVTYRSGNSNEVTCNWSASGYRLPTEAEWEKAARGGLSGLRFPWGDTINHSHANYKAGNVSYDSSGYTSYTHHPDYNDGVTPYTSPVGSFPANGYGLHDMIGNVFEWCWDWYDENFYLNGASDPRGPATGTNRVLRVGSWDSDALNGGNARRNYSNPSVLNLGKNGFRPARS